MGAHRKTRWYFVYRQSPVVRTLYNRKVDKEWARGHEALHVRALQQLRDGDDFAVVGELNFAIVQHRSVARESWWCALELTCVRPTHMQVSEANVYMHICTYAHPGETPE